MAVSLENAYKLDKLGKVDKWRTNIILFHNGSQ